MGMVFMVKKLYYKIFFNLLSFALLFCSVDLNATLCAMCGRLPAHEITINGHENYIWQVATESIEPCSPFTSLIKEAVKIKSEYHELCQCCLSLCLANNWNPETNYWRYDKCPVCPEEENCPLRPNLWKIRVICSCDQTPEQQILEQKIFCKDDKPKIVIIRDQSQLPGIIPEGLMSQKLIEQSPSKLEIRKELVLKELVLGVVFLTEGQPTQIDETIQAMILFGDSRVQRHLMGFYNAGVVVFDSKTGLPLSYAVSFKLTNESDKKQIKPGSLFGFRTRNEGVFYSKIIAIVPEPLWKLTKTQ